MRGHRDFLIVLTGQAVSAVGDAISLTALPLLVLRLTGSGALMGTVGALGVLPALVLGLPAGALADRWDRRKMMLWSDAGRAVLTAAIPLSFWLDWSTTAIILVVTVPINVLRILSDAAFTSSVPTLAGRENLERANSYLEATLSVPYIVGPAIAGVLVATIGAATTIAIDAVSFALSAASLVAVRTTLRAERPSALPSVLSDIKQGIQFVVRHVVLRTAILYWSAISVATAAIVPTLAFYITIDRDQGAQVFGFVGTTWSIGYLGGSLVAGRIGDRLMSVRLLGTGALIGVLVLVIAATDQPAVYLAASFLIGVALSIQLVSYMTLRASITPDELLGRVGSTARTISVGLQPVTLLGSGALIDAASGQTTLAVMGVTAVAASGLFALTPAFRGNLRVSGP